jgi:hypothetical protein
MAQGTYSFNVSIGGLSSSSSVVRTADNASTYEITLPVAHALSAWVKTDADTAAGNLASGHGLATGTFDVYWDGGQRYGVTCTITTNAVALDGGTGTDFPATANATVRMAPIVVDAACNIDGDNVDIAFVKLLYSTDPDTAVDDGERCIATFEDAAGDDILLLDTADGLTAQKTLIYDITGGDTNVFTGDPITTVTASQSSTTEAATLLIAVLQDATP